MENTEHLPERFCSVYTTPYNGSYKGVLLRERQLIRTPIKIICPRRSRGLIIILPARQSGSKVKCIAYERSECRQGIYWHEKTAKLLINPLIIFFIS